MDVIKHRGPGLNTGRRVARAPPDRAHRPPCRLAQGCRFSGCGAASRSRGAALLPLMGSASADDSRATTRTGRAAVIMHGGWRRVNREVAARHRQPLHAFGRSCIPLRVRSHKPSLNNIKSRYEITCPFLVISLRLLIAVFMNFLRSNLFLRRLTADIALCAILP